MRRDTFQYPSAPEKGCNTSKPEPRQYDGEELVGIVLVPKSNYVPVTKQADFKTDPKRR